MPGLLDKLRKVMLDNDEDLAQKWIQMLKEGDGRAWTIAMERVWPKPPTEISGPGGEPLSFVSLVKEASTQEEDD